MQNSTVWLAAAMGIPTAILGYRAYFAYRKGNAWRPLVIYWALAISAISLVNSGFILFLNHH